MSEDLVGASGGVLDDVVAAMGGTPREGQASMAAEAAMAIEERRHLMVQAGISAVSPPISAHCAFLQPFAMLFTTSLALSISSFAVA